MRDATRIFRIASLLSIRTPNKGYNIYHTMIYITETEKTTDYTGIGSATESTQPPQQMNVSAILQKRKDYAKNFSKVYI